MATIGGGGSPYAWEKLQDMARFVPPTGIGTQPPLEGFQPDTQTVQEVDKAREAQISDSLMRPQDTVSFRGESQDTGEMSSKQMMEQLKATGLNVHGGWS